VDLVLLRVFASVELQLWGVLLHRWIYVHAGALPDVVELFVNPECLGQSVEILVAVFRVGKAAADRQWSSVCGLSQLEVSVMSHYHKSGKCWSPEDGMVL
jgi:hypothetical protein